MPGRHRRLHRTGIVVTAAALSVAVVAGGAWAGYHEFGGERCTTTVPLTVAAATEIAPAVRAAADSWGERDDTCVAVTVTATDPATVAAAIGRRHGVDLGGTGARGQAAADADVWLPDSSTWLVRLGSEAPGFVPSVLGPVASSPIVLAAPQPTADRFARPTKDLVKLLATDRSVRPGLVDPARDATGLGGLITIAGAAGTGTSAAALRVGVMRALSANSSSIRGDLLQEFGTGVGLAPLSEADVIAYNAGRPATELAALYPSPAAAVLDYPYAVMPGVDPRKAAAATAFHQALGSESFRADLARAGVRGPGGTTGPGFAAPKGAPEIAPPPKAPAGAKVVGQLLGSWTAITQPGRMLAVFDVSGSMKATVPTAGGLTRAEVTQGVARQGLALLDDRWSVGNWTFSTNMAGRRPWVENLPISSCATHRPEMEKAIGKIVPKKDGDTGLYDTALAAYERVQGSWQAGVSNSVVIYTDGKNDNPGGLTKDQLIQRMTKLRDPRRPVRLLIIGMGTAIDRVELEAITKAAGSGGVYIAPDPAKIGDIFLEAIASRKGA